MLVNAPIGTPAERASGKVWPGHWVDSTGFGRKTIKKYANGYHTGADLNLNTPHWNADKGEPVYAAADGKVIWSANYCGTWGWIVVIEHVDDSGQNIYTRYAHLNHTNFLVTPADVSVTIGKVIGYIGNADGYYGSADHLHFDISLSSILKTTPDHWPGAARTATVLANLNRNYVDPQAFILANCVAAPQPNPATETLKVISTVLNIRARPNCSTPPIGTLKKEDRVEVRGIISGDGYAFAELLSVNGKAQNGPAYVAREFLGPA